MGTANTVVAIAGAGAGADGEAVVLRFDAPTGQVTAFRSTLSFQVRPAADGQPPERIVEAGPWAAIEAYVEDAPDTRFIVQTRFTPPSPARPRPPAPSSGPPGPAWSRGAVGRRTSAHTPG